MTRARSRAAVDILMGSAVEQRLNVFLSTLDGIPWLAHAGEPLENAVVVPDVATGWDGWNGEMIDTWNPRSRALEKLAQKLIGDVEIDLIFSRVSAELDQPVWKGLRDYFDRRPNTNENTACGADLSLRPELHETIKRDLSWAAVEYVIQAQSFFTSLVVYYRAGRWPCSWQGQYPIGQIVLL